MAKRDTFIGWLARVVTALTGTGATTNFTTVFATDVVTATTHGLTTGDGPFVLTSTTTLPAGLSLDPARYWVNVIDANTFKFCATRKNAIENIPVDLTDDGTGTHSFARAAEANEDIYYYNRQGHKPETIDDLADIDSL